MEESDLNSNKNEWELAELISRLNDLTFSDDIPTMDEIVEECRIVRALHYEKKLKELNQQKL